MSQNIKLARHEPVMLFLQCSCASSINKNSVIFRNKQTPELSISLIKQFGKKYNKLNVQKLIPWDENYTAIVQNPQDFEQRNITLTINILQYKNKKCSGF
jgi:hypothetical protein